jgi:hypothetical protein
MEEDSNFGFLGFHNNHVVVVVVVVVDYTVDCTVVEGFVVEGIVVDCIVEKDINYHYCCCWIEEIDLNYIIEDCYCYCFEEDIEEEEVGCIVVVEEGIEEEEVGCIVVVVVGIVDIVDFVDFYFVSDSLVVAQHNPLLVD